MRKSAIAVAVLGLLVASGVSQAQSSGDTLTVESVRIIRPGMGLPPKEFDRVLGRRVRIRVARGTPLSWDIIE